MKIIESKEENHCLSIEVHVTRLDAASARDFKKECDDLWNNGIQSITVNLAIVEFIDSSGVGALLSLYKRLPASNPSVKLLQVRPTVQAVIELLRLHRIFEIIP